MRTCVRLSGTRAPAKSLALSLLAVLTCGVAANPAAAHGYKFRVLYSFCGEAACSDGQAPAATLLMDQTGTLYGTTTLGGAGGQGTVFRLVPGGGNKWKHKTLYSFCSQPDCVDGTDPTGNLIADSSGNLYGATLVGGQQDGGVIFELAPNAAGGKWKYKLLYTFPCSGDEDCPNGRNPRGLIYSGASSDQPYDGTSPLFGAAGGGGAGGIGVIFKLEPQNRRWKQTVLYAFCVESPTCADGGNPEDTLVMDSAGRLFGTTYLGGGSTNSGTVFSVTGMNESVTYAFCSLTNCADGAHPTSPVLLDDFGHIFGTTSQGGAQGSGALFVVGGASEQVLYSFCSEANCADGAQPTSAGVIEDTAGNIFGVTPHGGNSSNAGVVFEFRNGKEHVLHTFCSVPGPTCVDGGVPSGGLIMDASGNIYGTTSGGGGGSAGDGGTVFELSPN